MGYSGCKKNYELLFTCYARFNLNIIDFLIKEEINNHYENISTNFKK